MSKRERTARAVALWNEAMLAGALEWCHEQATMDAPGPTAEKTGSWSTARAPEAAHQNTSEGVRK